MLEMTGDTRTREHGMKMRYKYSRLDIRRYSFSVRVARDWNGLPDDVVKSPTLNIFKSRINKHWKDIDIKFHPDYYYTSYNLKQTFYSFAFVIYDPGSVHTFSTIGRFRKPF